MTIELTQTQHAHTITVPDEWEYNGHTFQVGQDECTECPTQWLDSADALCVIGGPHGCILHHPAKTDCPAMWEFDNFHEEHGRTPTHRKNGQHFALTTGCTPVGRGWTLTVCSRPRSARMCGLPTPASHGCMSILCGQTATSG